MHGPKSDKGYMPVGCLREFRHANPEMMHGKYGGFCIRFRQGTGGLVAVVGV